MNSLHLLKKKRITPKIYIEEAAATNLPLFKGCTHSPNEEISLLI